MTALDTSLLVYAHRSRTDEHTTAQSAIQLAARSANGWCVPVPVLSEFWSVATHPASVGDGSPADQAAAFVEALVSAGAIVLDAQPGFGVRPIELSKRLELRGPRIFDLQIGLMAIEEGATEILTHDSAFLAPPGLTERDPLAEEIDQAPGCPKINPIAVV